MYAHIIKEYKHLKTKQYEKVQLFRKLIAKEVRNEWNEWNEWIESGCCQSRQSADGQPTVKANVSVGTLY